ncbi:MAG: ABC transporter permease [Chloroflexota bacterium]|nr:MAG: ABC transporter permease [Chloroflexota bacterium]
MRFQLTLAARYLSGRKLRTFLTTLAIVIGVMVIFGTGIYLPSFMDAFNKSLLSASGQTDVMITHKTGESFSASTLNKIKRIKGIAVIAGSLERIVNLPPNFYGKDSAVNAVALIGLDPEVAPDLHDYRVTQGRFLERGDGKVAVISERLADEVGLKLDDTLKLPTPEGVVKLTIVGLIPGRALIGNEQVLVTLTQAQKLFDMSGRISVIEANLTTRDKAESEAIVNTIKAQLGDTYTLGGLSSGSEFAGAMQLGQVMFNLFGVLTLAMGGFIIFNTFRTIVAERRHDIGMLRAIGANRATIVGLVLTEGLVQGVIGTAIGLGLGYLLGITITAGTSSIVKQLMNIEMTPVVEPSLVVVSIALGVGVTLFASLLPALNASRVTPMEALRPTPSQVMQRISRIGTIVGAVMIVVAMGGLITGNFALVALGGFLVLVGLVLVAPALVKPIAHVFGVLLALIFARQGTGELAQGNLTRQPSRAAITASATMIGLAIIVGAGGMMFSTVGTVMELFSRTLGSDYLLIPPSVAVWKGDVGASASLKAKIKAAPGVGVVSSLRYAQSSLHPAARRTGTGETMISVLGIDPVEYPKISGMDFQKGNAQDAFSALAASERNVIVNGILAASTDLNIGDTIPLVTTAGVKDYRVIAIGGEVMSMKINTAYISQANMKADFRKSEDIFYQVDLAPGADPAAVEQRLDRVVEDYPQFRLVAGREYTAEFRRQYDAIYAGFYVLLGVLAFPSLIAILNTLAIGVIERTREIGMLRAIGATRGQVWKTIVAEALLLASLGTAFGILAGLYLSYVFVQGLSASGIFKVAYTFPLAGVLAAIAAGLIFGVLAALVPARQASSMEIIKALRYE